MLGLQDIIWGLLLLSPMRIWTPKAVRHRVRERGKMSGYQCLDGNASMPGPISPFARNKRELLIPECKLRHFEELSGDLAKRPISSSLTLSKSRG